jgi:site-specific DNA recombinase
MEKNILAPKGGIKWSRGTVGRLMRNPVYVGVSYAGRTKTVNGRRIQCSRQEWIELPDLVDKPAFTPEEWQLIQRQLDRNRELSPRHQKQQYLLKGITRCRRCGRKYYGLPVHGKPYYRCSGRIRLLSPEPCDSKAVNATWLENLVWQEIEKALRNPDLLLTYLRKQRESKDSPNHLEERLQLNKNMLRTHDEAETKYLRLYGAGVITEEKLREEAARIKKEVERITRENADLEKQLAEIQDLEINIESVRQLCGLMAKNLESLTFDEKRFALNALCVQVWKDGDSITIEGNLPKTECITASQQWSLLASHWKYPPQRQPDDLPVRPQQRFLPWLTWLYVNYVTAEL